MSAQADLFGEPLELPVEDLRLQRLRTLMLAELRKPWPAPPAIAEPSDAEKVAFAEAFLIVSRPSR